MFLLVCIEFLLIDYPITNINIAKGSILSNITCFLDKYKKDFVLGIINKLKKLLIPSKIKGILFFNLTIILYSLFYSKRYDFLII
jgi:hypothetical protein